MLPLAFLLLKEASEKLIQHPVTNTCILRTASSQDENTPRRVFLRIGSSWDHRLRWLRLEDTRRTPAKLGFLYHVILVRRLQGQEAAPVT